MILSESVEEHKKLCVFPQAEQNLIDHLLLKAIRKFLLECMTEHFEHAVRCVKKWRWLDCVVYKLLLYISKELLAIYHARFLTLGLVATLDCFVLCASVACLYSFLFVCWALRHVRWICVWRGSLRRLSVRHGIWGQLCV